MNPPISWRRTSSPSRARKISGDSSQLRRSGAICFLVLQDNWISVQSEQRCTNGTTAPGITPGICSAPQNTHLAWKMPALNCANGQVYMTHLCNRHSLLWKRRSHPECFASGDIPTLHQRKRDAQGDHHQQAQREQGQAGVHVV